MSKLQDALDRRFGDAPDTPQDFESNETLAVMAARGSARRFAEGAVPDNLIRTLAAIALSSPTKSDLQQRDILLVSDPALRDALHPLLGGQDWVRAAPALLVFIGNHRRQRRLHDLRGRPFVNDHADALFNAACDAAVALSAFVTAAEAAGLAACPISAIRNEAADVARLLALPERTFPMAGLALGWPAAPPEISPRLPLAATFHVDRFDDAEEAALVAAYDVRRRALQPYRSQRFPEDFGDDPAYCWSEDKARQYSRPERASFGAFLRAQRFKAD